MRTLRMDGCKTPASRLVRAVAAALMLSVAVSSGFTGQCNKSADRYQASCSCEFKFKKGPAVELKVRTVSQKRPPMRSAMPKTADALMLANDSLMNSVRRPSSGL